MEILSKRQAEKLMVVRNIKFIQHCKCKNFKICCWLAASPSTGLQVLPLTQLHGNRSSELQEKIDWTEMPQTKMFDHE